LIATAALALSTVVAVTAVSIGIGGRMFAMRHECRPGVACDRIAGSHRC
jgi:hypothetical protein